MTMYVHVGSYSYLVPGIETMRVVGVTESSVVGSVVGLLDVT